MELVVRKPGRSLELGLRPGDEGVFNRYWLPRLVGGGVDVQVCPLYGEGARRPDARRRTLAQVEEFDRIVRRNGERVCHVRTRAELDDPRVRLVLAMEGMEPLEGDPGAFEEWWARGVRTASLTWNHPNDFAGGIEAPAQGLSDRGRVLVHRFHELGVVLDLAHASEQTWRDVFAEQVPFSVTHAGCRAVCDHPRNLADWQLEALAERGGVLGMMALPFVVDARRPTLSRWLDHFDHAISVMGIEHVGLGADFVDQVAAPEHEPEGDEGEPASTSLKSSLALDDFRGPDDYPTLIAALRDRGYAEDRLEAITSGNWLRILWQALPA